jgi:2-polyprenyl-3-methyl-5-hydroxy-6-metoxy-1,4-benzoquinol methylase
MKYNDENYVISEGTGSWEKHSNAQIMESYQEHITGEVLDVGCNTGGVTYWLSHNNNVKSITGVDINPQVEEIFNKNMDGVEIEVNFIACNYLQRRAINKEFDTVISFHTLEHIYPEDAIKFATNIAFNLKKGGKAVISLPYEKAYADDHHKAFYNEKKLVLLFESAGMKCIECFKDDRWHENNLLTGLFTKE